MNPRRSATLSVAIYPAAIVAGWAVVTVCGVASPRVEASRAVQAVERIAPALAAQIAPPQTIAAAQPAIAATSELASTEDIIAKAFPPAAADVANDPQPASEPQAAAEPQPVGQRQTVNEPKSIVVAALTDPAEILSPAMVDQVSADQPARASAAPADSQQPLDIATAPPRLEIIGECLVAEPCIDQYLFALYMRTPKEDTIKETERRKVQIKRRGKFVTVTRSFTRLVDNDFTWKDPKAAERINMSMSDYVIGGMDKSFKLKLFYMLQAAENAGLQPGITSAFRDDYRQSIAAGLKAASDRSYHGGSSRGGYGKGLAADITSVKGANRAQRWTSTETLWKWVDANGKQYGIGRPYLGRDPPHVGPIDGPEYVSKRGGAKAADVKKRDKQASHRKLTAAKPQVASRSQSSGATRRMAQAN